MSSLPVKPVECNEELVSHIFLMINYSRSIYFDRKKLLFTDDLLSFHNLFSYLNLFFSISF
jgi:hypothetical protein